MTNTQRTLTIIATTTAIGMVGDILLYSLGKSNGGSFKLHAPKGSDLLKIAAIGIITGTAVNYVTKKLTT